MKKGFTLIELLVVVLIIGILSAIALPQYQKAVEKARLAEVWPNAASLRNAIDLYLLENDWSGDADFLGEDADESGVLSIDFEGGLDCTQNGGAACGSKNFTYQAYCRTNYCQIWIERHQGGNHSNSSEYEIYWTKSKSTNKWTVWNDYTNNSEQLCESLRASWCREGIASYPEYCQ